jgi:molybdenum cofactor cytidylyltransferase
MPADRSGPVAGVVLAAGASTRMGQNKLLLRLEGETIVRRAARSALEAGLDPVIVVLGHEAEQALAELSGLPLQPVTNSDYARGVNLSVRVGIAAVPARAAAAVVLLADMPFVTDRMIAALVRRYRESAAPLVISDYAGVYAPPHLYDRFLFAELGAMEGEGCGKQVVKRHEAEAALVAWPAMALTDLDRPEDYERVKAQLSAGEAACVPTS